MLAYLEPFLSALAGILVGLALSAVLIVIVFPLDAALLVVFGVISLGSKITHRRQGSLPFVLLGMGSATVVAIAIVLTR